MRVEQSLPPLYCTWSHRDLLPPALRAQFRDLDDFLREVMSSAKSRLIIVSPYLSPGGMASLRSSMVVSAQRGAWIRLVTSDLESFDSFNRHALKALLRGREAEALRARIRILVGAKDIPLLIHAKIVVVDGEKGYLGSANLSLSGLEKNLEVGVALEPNQAHALDELVSVLEATGVLADCTDSFRF